MDVPQVLRLTTLVIPFPAGYKAGEQVPSQLLRVPYLFAPRYGIFRVTIRTLPITDRDGSAAHR